MYSDGVKTYLVTPELAGFDRRRMLLRFLVAASLFAAVQMLLATLWPSWTPGHLSGDAVRAVIGGIIFAFLFVAVFMKRILTYEVLVSDDCITLRGAFLFPRSVRRGQAKTIAESNGNIFTAPALRISKYGRFGTWFWGGIWVPKALPEYEYVRGVALSWKASL
ncbi:MAG: hypothetical protein WB799_21750 [Candidatus Sulfotelmatobacter sp.]